jgi:hypothetical protein
MSRKSQLYALVAELHGWNWTRKQLAEEFSLTPQRIGQILRDVRKTPFPSLDAARAAIPFLLWERLENFHSENDGQAR